MATIFDNMMRLYAGDDGVPEEKRSRAAKQIPMEMLNMLDKMMLIDLGPAGDIKDLVNHTEAERDAYALALRSKIYDADADYRKHGACDEVLIRMAVFNSLMQMIGSFPQEMTMASRDVFVRFINDKLDKK